MDDFFSRSLNLNHSIAVAAHAITKPSVSCISFIGDLVRDSGAINRASTCESDILMDMIIVFVVSIYLPAASDSNCSKEMFLF